MPNTLTDILICGPTASGKSAVALELAQRVDGIVVNADALQVYDNWRVLTARPSVEDENLVEHRLYGHIGRHQRYSVGEWLRDINSLRQATVKPLIIVGGTGLYFTSLTKGLVDIPAIPDEVRTRGDQMRLTGGIAAFKAELDKATLENIDTNNPMRLQRAWEVLVSTGRGLADWHAETPAPLIKLEDTCPIVLNSDKNWLNSRIEQRFHHMVENGALSECQDNLNDGWDPALPSSQALGAPELIAYLRDQVTLENAINDATIATRQFAKRQRTWFRSKMMDWHPVSVTDSSSAQLIADYIAKAVTNRDFTDLSRLA